MSSIPRQSLIDAMETELLNLKVRLEHMAEYDIRYIDNEYARQKLFESAQQSKTLLTFARALRADPAIRQVEEPEHVAG